MATDKTVAALPEVLPIFPLSGAVMFPRVQLPLNIFEPRYLAMVNDSIASHKMIGIIQPTGSNSANPATATPLYSVGTVGEIVEHAHTDDGRILITLNGVMRFRVLEEVKADTAYRQVKINVTDYVEDFFDDVQFTGARREPMEASLKNYLTALGLNADWSAVSVANDEMLVNGMTMLCPFESAEKQLCLEAKTVDDRADVLMNLMQFAIQSNGTAMGNSDRSTVSH